MKADLGSLTILNVGNRLALKRSKSFKFFQWLSYSLMVIVMVCFSIFFVYTNLERIKEIAVDGTMEQKVIMISIFLADFLFIVYMLWNIRRTTVNHEITVNNSVLAVDSKHLFNLTEPVSVAVIRNVGWKGLGVSYSAAIKLGNKKRIVAYYLNKNQIDVTVDAMENFLETSKVTSVK